MLIDQAFQIFNSDAAGVLKSYDITRGKWLSLARETSVFSLTHKKIKHPQWLKYEGINTNNNGFLVIRDATITSVWGRSGNSANCVFHIRKNDDPTNIYDLTLTSQIYNVDSLANVDVDEGDFIQVYLSIPTESTNYPTCGIEIAYR